jgi:hypothetical protein
MPHANEFSTQAKGTNSGIYPGHRQEKGIRYRGFCLDPNGRYKSAGTYGTEELALDVARQAEKHAAALIGGATGGPGPGHPRHRGVRARLPAAPPG